MDWEYDSRARCWRFTLGAWEVRVERWPASLEYLAQLTSPAPERRVIRAPHVFAQREAAQAWCLDEIAGQGAG
jgi:hypothetical protein